MEWDIRSQPPTNICGTEHAPNNDWFMYHSIGPTDLGRCDHLSDCLKLLAGFHNAVPEHEVVTIHLEMKGGDDGGSCDVVFPSADDNNRHDPGKQTPEGLDARLREHLGSALFTPADLMRRCPGAADMQAAVKQCGWPTLDELRGKIIIATFAANWNSSTHAEDSSWYYAGPSNAVAEARAAFVAPLHFTDTGAPYPGLQANHWAVINTEVFDPQNARAVRQLFPGSIIRSADRDDPTDFYAGQDDFNYILTERIDLHSDPWARSHNQFGYPFCPRGVHATMCYGDPQQPLANKKEIAHSLAIDVRSGDIWDSHDDFAFAFSYLPTGGGDTLSAFVSDASDDNVHHWAKGCVMARADASPTSPYYAVCRAGDDEELFIQYRSYGCNGTCGTGHDYASLGHGIQGEDATYVKLSIWPNGSGGVMVQGYGSADGANWQAIGSPQNFPTDLPMKGIAASSNDPNHSNADGTPTRYVFGNVMRGGQRFGFDARAQTTAFTNKQGVGNAPYTRFTDLSYFGDGPCEKR
jgi:hypothetical protein